MPSDIIPPSPNAAPAKRPWYFFRTWESRTAFALFLAALGCGMATYASMREMPPFGKDSGTVLWLLNVDLIILLALCAVVARKILILLSGRRRGLAGSGLHIRLVYAFSVLAAAPVIVMIIASSVFFHFGVQTWFSDRIQTAIEESNAVAKAYYAEHREVIRADVLAMANDLDRSAAFLLSDEGEFEQAMQTQSLLRNFSEAIVFDLSGHVIARSGLTFSLEFETVPDYMLKQADEGDVVIGTGSNDDRIRALVKLNAFPNTYLYVGRMVDPKVIAHMTATREAAEDYADLRARYSDLQIKVTLIFTVVGLLLLSMAIWYGLILARQIVAPIGALIEATERVRAGDLTARAPEGRKLEEFDYLASAFNRMTEQIGQQREDLIEANRQIDRRRHLIESVLTGVSSGVIGIDADRRIHLANASAQELLGIQEGSLKGRVIEDALPGAEALLQMAYRRPRKTTQAEIPFQKPDGTRHSFLAKIVTDAGEGGAILTFDDITELQSAQRKAAWADVARRIAHEIKNPLTPIQLSAERLRRKYIGQITEDSATFSQYTDTIIRHVEDIGRMVNEFSAFARMPDPVMAEGDLRRDVEEALFLHRQARGDVAFAVSGEASAPAFYDPAQLRQAVNNLIQNAIDSVDARAAAQRESGETPSPARVDIRIGRYGDDEIFIAVSDNGLGLPAGVTPAKLAEPYVTHKLKGTGLGLAIVKKIMEDHNGSLLIGAPEWLRSMEGWEDIGGATIALLLPLRHRQKETIAA